MHREEIDTQERLQAVRPFYNSKNNNTTQNSSLARTTDWDVVQVAIYLDPASREIVFWEDILIAFKNALHIRQGSCIIPFLRGSDYMLLYPLRIAAIPNKVLDVYVDEPSKQTQTTNQAALSQTRSLSNSQMGTRVINFVEEIMEDIVRKVSEHVLSESGVTPKSCDANNSNSSNGDMSTTDATAVNTRCSENHYRSVEGGPSGNTPPQQEQQKAVQDYTNTDDSISRHSIDSGRSKVESPDSPRAQQGKQRPVVNDNKVIPKRMRDFAVKAKEGDIESQNSLADFYKYGFEGVSRNDKLAMEWYSKAAEQGHAEAQLRMGEYYSEGFAVPKDYAKAMEWFHKSARQGYCDAQYKVGSMHSSGEGAPQDKNKALDWFLKAANGGHAGARERVVFLREQGYSVPTEKSMYREETETQEGLQAIRPVYNTSVPSASTAVAYTDHEVVHVCTNVGVEGQEVLYWEDILFAFKGALSIRYGSKILLPLRGSDGKRLDPLCIAAIPDVILEVHMECQWTRADTAPLILEPPQSSQMISVNNFSTNLECTSLDTGTDNSSRVPPGAKVDTFFDTFADTPAGTKAVSSSKPSDVSCASVSVIVSVIIPISNPVSAPVASSFTARINLLKDLIDATLTESNNLPVQAKVPEITSSNTTSSTDGQTKVSAGTHIELLTNANMPTKASSSRSINSQKTQSTTAKKSTRTTVEDITETPATAEQRRVEDQVLKAISYKEGSSGSQQNYVLAMYLFRKAAVQGNSIAQYNIGLLHEEGHGVMKDSMKAASWYRKAADQGLKDAQSCLGTLYVKGDGIQKSNALALQWFVKAAEQGDTSAQFNLGCMYFTGEGVPVHNGRAMTWFKKAAQGGHLRAREAYEDLMDKGFSPDANSGVMLIEQADIQKRVQAVCPIYTHRLATTPPPESEIFYIDVHPTDDGMDILLWEDIQFAFKGAVNIRCGIRVLSFLKDKNFRRLEPPRIAAVPNTVLDVLVGFPLMQIDKVIAAMPVEHPSLASSPSTPHPALRRSFQQAPQSPPPSPPPSMSRPDNMPPPPQYTTQATSALSEEDTDYLRGQPNIPEAVSSCVTDDADAYVTVNINASIQVNANGDLTNAVATNSNLSSGSTHSQQQVHFSAENNADILFGDITYTFVMAKEGDVQAQVRLATAYKNGTDGLLQMYDKAMKWLLRAAAQGHAGAECEIGRLFETGRGVEEDHFTAVAWYRRAAHQSLAAAQKNLAVMYTQGWGVEENFIEAAYWYRKAADQGHSSAQFNLAILYYHGEGVPKDYSRARELFCMAALQGHAKAQFKAVPWFNKAANQGHTEAQSCLGVIWFRGKGVVQDLGEALKWFKKAAHQGHVPSMYNLGVLYNTGVHKDRSLALGWLLMAADEGYKGARDAYETLRVHRDYI
ncbi:hypothetical protein BGX24_007313 [Mortierella sp. AD032]|nr:hypothetical protein BGX24_007313 [Mortierella sp. AD032]